MMVRCYTHCFFSETMFLKYFEDELLYCADTAFEGFEIANLEGLSPLCKNAKTKIGEVNDEGWHFRCGNHVYGL